MVIRFAMPNPQHLKVSGAILTLSLAAGMLPAFAGEIKSPSRIDAVILFPQGAQITRLVNIDLGQGEQTLIFDNLPQNIIANSIRVEGEADGTLEIGSIDTRSVFVQDAAFEKSERKRIRDEIERLNDERRSFDNVIQSATTQINLLQNLAGLPAISPRPAPVAAAAQPQDWQLVLNMIGNIEALLGRVQKAQQQQRSLGKQIKELEKQLSMLQPRRDRRTELKVHLNAKSALKGSLRIRYQLRSAGWTPFYDMRLNTGSKTKAPTMELVRRAAISQNSGENWDNITLLLSTTRPQASTAAPVLRPQRIGFREPIAAFSRNMVRKKSKAIGKLNEMAMDASPAPAAESRAEPKKARERQARVRSYGFQATYQIPGRVSLASGARGKKVRIDTSPLAVKLKIRTVPRRAARAYLYADISWKGKTALLPGRSSLYRDGAFVGSGSIGLINSGEDKELGFGVDDKVVVKRVQLAREKSVSGIISRSKIDVQDYKITIHNLHERALPVTVLDQIPYSEEEEIKVTLLPETTKPARKNDKDRRGILAWDIKLNAGEKQSIRLKYQLEWPKKKEIVIRPQ